MSNMIDAPLEKNQIQLTEKYRLTIDRMNKSLTERYIRRLGRGKSAELSNEYGYGNDKYFNNYKRPIEVLLSNELDDVLSEGISESERKDLEVLSELIEKVFSHIDKVADEIAKNMEKQIIINIESSKRGKKAKSEEELVEDDGDVVE